MTQRTTDHFSACASGYAQFRPTYPQALMTFLTEQSPACGLAWEAGCGSGQLTSLLATRFDRVIATDISHTQLQYAPPHPSISYLCASAELSCLKPQRADLAVSAQAAHWFDLPVYYQEVRRVVKPGGLLAMIGYHTIRGDGDIGDAVARYYGELLGPYWPHERRHVESRYRTLGFPFDEIAAPDCTIDVSWTREQLAGYLLSWSAVARYEAATGASARDWLQRELDHCWAQEADVCHFYFPVFTRAGRVG